MNENTVVQFECFETNIETDQFLSSWEFYAKRFVTKGIDVTLQKQVTKKSRYKYVSQHECPEDGFNFSFMKGRFSENFPEANVRVVQAGGYEVLQMQCEHDADPKDVKIMLFIKNDRELDECRKAPFYQVLNIYQSYFESCLYAYIVEFFVKENLADDFITWVNSNTTVAEPGIYKECKVLHE